MEIGTKIIKLNWKQKMVSAIWTGLMYAGMLSLFDFFSDEKLYSVNSLIFQGLFFGIAMAIGLPYVTKKIGIGFTSPMWKNIQPELEEGEEIEIEGPANLFRGIEGVGGKIFLTNRNVIFKSHKMNIQKGQTNVPYKSVIEIIERKTAKLIDNGIRIRTDEGKEFDFIVNERDIWMEKLSEKME